ncbi:hypothetical protein [Vibrio harveyi]|uniref:hypothetical protein n=1 Tax=Vibrio harveyi TaxID=669 RepID=UPI0011AF0D68|nr:hypothetical protein [Vibrio harveyi]EKO3838797.1 hypothetical protein [Vibrio harveyi]
MSISFIGRSPLQQAALVGSLRRCAPPAITHATCIEHARCGIEFLRTITQRTSLTLFAAPRRLTQLNALVDAGSIDADYLVLAKC